jgi:outer membrane protein assembly factor BamD (BamD/ComL family)
MKRSIFLFLASLSSLYALEEEELVWEQTGPSVQEYNSRLQDAIAAEDWWEVVDCADVISYNFPTSPFAQEASFCLGQAYYKLQEWDYSNEAFSAYLNHTTSPKHFEEAIEYKFMIAEQFAHGAKRRLFGARKLPAWVPAKEDAILIYEEVIAALPHSETAAKALLGKAKVQSELADYKGSIETLELLIRRFPKDELAAEAYLERNRVHLKQCKEEVQDPSILDLVQLNLKKFRQSFPREPRLAEAEKIYNEAREVFAQNLLETGRFYEKTKKLPASRLYYQKVVASYPGTESASIAQGRLDELLVSGAL